LRDSAGYGSVMPAVSLSRRNLLIGGGVGLGLVIGFALWPRTYAPGLNVAPGEHVLNGFVKVGEDGHVTVVVPQVELGHGVFTTHAQIVADELGADWRTIAVEAARAGPLYANGLLMREWDEGLGRSAPAQLFDRRGDVLATGGSTSVRGFEGVLRDAGAAARALLCSAAAERWDADWRACDTHDGFVWRGDQRMRFGEVAAEAAKLKLPGDIAWRTGSANRLVGQELPRLDLPSKVDGSVSFAADIRLPDMVYAAISEGPAGDARLKSIDKAAAQRVTGVTDVVETERWVAVAATNWWAANEGLRAAKPQFTVTGPLASDRSMAKALDAAFDAGERMSALGDIGGAFAGADVLTQSYHIGLAPHAAVETAALTVQIDASGIQLWAATQVPGLAAQAAARALGIGVDRIVVHPMMVGGSFGARYETDLIGHAATLADRLKRPVQLMRSRSEEMRRDAFRPAAAVRLAARTTAEGRIGALFAQIATPAALHELDARIIAGKTPAAANASARGVAEPAAIAGAATPYDIPVHAIDHHPAALGVPTGDWRGRACGANVFATECFVDEIAHMIGNDPFSVRMAMLGQNPRLAQCLTKVAETGGWQGGVQGSNQGLAVATLAGGCIAVLAEARIGEGGRVRVDRLCAVTDVGRIIHPGIVRSQILGGLIFGMSAATGAPVSVHRGLAGPERYGELRLPRLADCPKIEIEMIVSNAEPGGAGELAVPPVAPAIANALFAATGVRFRQLPLIQDA
jgi:isoquinoline 1-oxidoreductase subunit beta